MKRFDRKFGVNFIGELSTTPAVYLFRDDSGEVIYVGKAKNVRKRLSSYRNASRRKVHRKMRAIVEAAASIEVRPQVTERDALLVENELIRTLRPAFNIDGKYAFLYPAIGVARHARHTLLCFTTDTAAFEAHGLDWYGTFRSRPRAKEAFDALVELLALLGHLERTSTLGPIPEAKGSRLAGLRQLDAAIADSLPVFLGGAAPDLLSRMSAALLEKPRARREASYVQELIHLLDDFYRSDLAPLRFAIERAGRDGTFVPQQERDALFIETRGPTSGQGL